MGTVDEALEQVREAGFRLLYGYVRDPRPAEIVVDLDTLLELPPTTLVFHELESLWSGDFEYELPDERPVLERLNEPLDPRPVVDLLTLEPDLKGFKTRTGEAFKVTFNVPVSGVLVSCSIAEAWYGEFLGLQSRAREQARARAQEEREAQRAAEAAGVAEQMQRVRLLLDDPQFLKLARLKSTAQRTLLTYAKTREPEAVAALGEVRTKELLAELRDLVLLERA